MSRMRQITENPERYDPWFADILARKPGEIAAVAMANKTARMVWAVLTKNQPYRVRTIRAKPKHRDSKTNEVMENLSVLKPRHTVLCPEHMLLDMQNGTWFVENIHTG